MISEKREPRTFRLRSKVIDKIEGLAKRGNTDKTKALEKCIEFYYRLITEDINVEEASEIRCFQGRNTILIVPEKEVKANGY